MDECPYFSPHIATLLLHRGFLFAAWLLPLYDIGLESCRQLVTSGSVCRAQLLDTVCPGLASVSQSGGQESSSSRLRCPTLDILSEERVIVIVLFVWLRAWIWWSRRHGNCHSHGSLDLGKVAGRYFTVAVFTGRGMCYLTLVFLDWRERAVDR